MPEPLILRKKLVGATVESTKGTNAAVTAALSDTVVYNANMAIADMFAGGERMPDGHYGGQYDAERGPLMGELTFQTEWRYGDATKTLLSACGLYEYDAGGNPNDMRPTLDLSEHETLTMKLWEDGRVKEINGAMGTFTISATNGGRIFFNWRFIGVPEITQDSGDDLWPVAEAMPALAPLNGSLYVARGNTLTLASFTPLVSSIGFDFGASLEMREDVTVAESAYLHAVVTDFNPIVSLDPEANLVANQDEWRKALSKTTEALTWTVSDGTNSASITAPRAQRRGLSTGSRGKRLTDPVSLSLNASSGDDNFTIVLPS